MTLDFWGIRPEARQVGGNPFAISRTFLGAPNLRQDLSDGTTGPESAESSRNRVFYRT